MENRMARYKLLVGVHQDERGRDYVAKDIVQSSRPLDRVFPNKFELLKEKSTTKETPVKPVKVKQEEPEGINVTGDFPDALVNDFKVYRKSRWHYVYASDDLSLPLNNKGLTSKKVNSFIQNNI